MTEPISPGIRADPAAATAAWRGWPYFSIAAILALTVIALRLEGRIWFCDCGSIRIWITDVWSSHCSQHLFDPYSITHMSHGLIFAMALGLLAPRMRTAWQFCIAVAIAAAWEVLENSPLIINRYRESTMSLDYLGDSIVNSLGDIAACAAGFFIARKIGWKWTLALFALTELLLLWLIRDNLTLNVVMLIRPVEAIKLWQSAGH